MTRPGPSRRPIATLLALVTALAVVWLAAPAGTKTLAPDGGSGESGARAQVNERHVVAISVDGLNPRALKRLGRSGAPNLHRLIRDEGAGTLNARSQVELTLTLPNHTSMVTGRRIKAAKGGHGVTWNDDTVRTTVPQAAGHDVSSVFREVHAGGGTTAVYATKTKFTLFQRSWPGAVDRSVVTDERNGAAVKALRADLASNPRSFSFLHLGKPDQIGHESGWLSARYLKAVAKMDRLIGTVLRQISGTPSLRSSTVVVLTSDHGGIPGSTRHSARKNRENFRVPFAVWGAGVTHRDLYALNPTRLKPGRTQPGAGAARQPIRNGELANVSLDVLGLGPVPGSIWNARQDLRWN